MRDRRYLIVYNPTSGGGAASKAESLRRLLLREGAAAELRETAPDRNVFRDGHDGFDALVVVGGDGTLNDALNGLPPGAPPVALLGAGTVNVFAAEMGLPLDAEGCARMLRSGVVAEVPLIRAGDRRFVLFLEAGLLGRVVRQVNDARRKARRHGKAEFVTAFVAAALATWGRRVRVEVEFEGGGPARVGPWSNVLVTRARRYAESGRIPLAAGGTRPLLEPAFTVVGWRTRTPFGHTLLIAAVVSGFLPRLLPLLRRIGMIEVLPGARLRILAADGLACHADAETVDRCPTVVEFDGALKVLLPEIRQHRA